MATCSQEQECNPALAKSVHSKMQNSRKRVMTYEVFSEWLIILSVLYQTSAH